MVMEQYKMKNVGEGTQVPARIKAEGCRSSKECDKLHRATKHSKGNSNIRGTQ